MAFKQLEGETAIVSQGGVFRQCDLYEWDGKLFAKFGSGFIRLKENGSTSKDGVNLCELQLDAPIFKDRFGRLTVTGGDGRTEIGAAGALRLTVE